MTDKKLIPETPSSYPTFGNGLTRAAGRFSLRLLGWRVTGQFPETNRFIMAVAPHTSNWDFIVGFSAMVAIGFQSHWLGKDSLFAWPVGGLLRRSGGIPVTRHAATGVVGQVAARFGSGEPMILAVTPEGTRKRVEKLKTGFIRISIAADVPILLTAFDYSCNEIKLGELFHPTGDIDADEQFVRDHYRQFRSKNPEQYCP